MYVYLPYHCRAELGACVSVTISEAGLGWCVCVCVCVCVCACACVRVCVCNIYIFLVVTKYFEPNLDRSRDSNVALSRSFSDKRAHPVSETPH